MMSFLITDESHTLQSLWKKVRDRYVRERKKRRSSNLNDPGTQQVLNDRSFCYNVFLSRIVSLLHELLS